MLVTTPEQVDEIVNEMKEVPLVVYDLETTGLSPYHGDRLIGVALLIPNLDDGDDVSKKYYLPFRHAKGVNLPMSCLYKLAPILADPDRVLVGHNLKFDIQMTEADNISVHNTPLCSMLGAHLANENEMSFALKKLGTKYVDKEAAAAEAELLAKTGKGSMYKLPAEDVHEYAEQDVVLTWRLAVLYQSVLREQGLLDLWYEVNEYSKAVMAMEKRGCLLNVPLCKKNLAIAQQKCEELYAKMVEIAGYQFNPRSYVQVGHIIGQKETNKEALEKCDHPLVPVLQEFRGWQRAVSNYYGTFLEKRDENNRIHPNILMHGTISGRMSCQDPPMQALPKESDVYKVRDVIVAPPGHFLLAADYSQVELRLLAHYTQDPFLLKAYNEGLDLHGMTAENLSIPRFYGKTMNFTMVYGAGADALALKLKIPKKDAKDILTRYHEMIPGIKKLYYAAEAKAKRDKKIVMWTGRVRHYRPHDEFHKAMSNLIQGGVAEIMRITITRLYNMLLGTGIKMILQVHDEIIFEIPEGLIAEWLPKIKRVMEDFQFRVPLVAEMKLGYSWGSAEKVELPEEGDEENRTDTAVAAE